MIYVAKIANKYMSKMVERENHQRMLDKDKIPTTEDILKIIGKQAEIAWNKLTNFMQTNYEIEPETVFYGKNYGWLIRYRKSGKTLCSIFPEKNSFTFQITYGKKEVEKFLNQKEEFNQVISEIFESTKQLHDGRWLFIRLLDDVLVQDIVNLITIKRKPKKK